MRRWGRRLFAFAVVLVMGLAGVSVGLVRTERGQRIALKSKFPWPIVG